MTETVTQIINAALNELFERGVIDLPPEEMQPEEIEKYNAFCFIETGPGGTPIMVTFPDWLVFIEERNDEYTAYFSVERERVTA